MERFVTGLKKVGICQSHDLEHVEDRVRTQTEALDELKHFLVGSRLKLSTQTEAQTLFGGCQKSWNLTQNLNIFFLNGPSLRDWDLLHPQR